jgi:hypothetical protein
VTEIYRAGWVRRHDDRSPRTLVSPRVDPRLAVNRPVPRAGAPTARASSRGLGGTGGMPIEQTARRPKRGDSRCSRRQPAAVSCGMPLPPSRDDPAYDWGFKPEDPNGAV